MAKSDKESVGDKNISAVEEALSKTEKYIEKNQKIIMYVIGAIVVVVGGYMLFKKFYLEPKEEEAQKQMFWAERYFEKDSLDLALNGDGNNIGFLEVIDEYGMTKASNLAHYYAGMCLLKKGQYEEAIDQLEDFDSDDQLVAPMATGAIGDAYMELGDNDKALKQYMEAADMNNNQFSTPFFLMKAGWTYEVMGNYDEALKLYERIRTDYYKSVEWREIDKYITRAKALSSSKE
ncbi:MAG TPA: tetratricopeptide repeat protein [Bacteroidales bacterium]|mgnify:CR=1 FL=1|nr:tetratricopeptide repeat protein [Bacteroidales bacterium]HPS16930.1 tetratricopeptide repeat protein [Bacteroidales bacterium]